MTNKVKVVEREHDFMAYLNGDPTIWQAGKTSAEAIGKLIFDRSVIFDIELEFD